MVSSVYYYFAAVDWITQFFFFFSHFYTPSVILPLFLSFLPSFFFHAFVFCGYICPLGHILFSHSPDSQLPAPLRVDQQAGVIETSPRGQQCCSYHSLAGFLKRLNLFILYFKRYIHTQSLLLYCSGSHNYSKSSETWTAQKPGGLKK